MRNDPSVAVIGAGLGGLSAALSMASKGVDVDVYEKLKVPGGKASEKRIGGYRFDLGPSLLTLPKVFKDLFARADEEVSDHLEFIRLDPITRYFFDDGTILDARADRERFADEVQEKLGEKRDTVLRYLDRCKRTYEASTPLFMFKPLHESSTLISPETIRTFFRTPKMDAFRTMHSVNSRWFRDKRTVQLFDRYATYNGSSPYLTPATFNLIQHVEYGIGGFGVKGGIHRIPKVLERLCKREGVSFHFDTEVDRIVIEEGKVKGIDIGGKQIGYDTVVSNSDVTNTYSKLLSDKRSSNARKYSKLEPSSSGQVFLWGIKRSFSELLTNNIFFSSDYEREFDDIWNGKRSPHDPTVYVNITGKLDREDAPGECENWFVLVNVPYDSSQDWDRERERTKNAVLHRLEGSLGNDVEPFIEVEDSLGPKEIEERYGGNKGSIYGISSNSRASAFLRQSNRSRAYRGLFFAGGSAHPGGGMPLVLLSGMHAADIIIKQLKE